MIGMMELAAIDAINTCYDAGESSVGMSIEVSHMAATPPGHRVRAEAELTKVEGPPPRIHCDRIRRDRAIARHSFAGRGDRRAKFTVASRPKEKAERAELQKMSEKYRSQRKFSSGRDYGGIAIRHHARVGRDLTEGTGDDNRWYAAIRRRRRARAPR